MSKAHYDWDDVVGVEAGHIAQYTNDCEDVWHQIGANWAVSRTLLKEWKASA